MDAAVGGNDAAVPEMRRVRAFRGKYRRTGRTNSATRPLDNRVRKKEFWNSADARFHTELHTEVGEILRSALVLVRGRGTAVATGLLGPSIEPPSRDVSGGWWNRVRNRALPPGWRRRCDSGPRRVHATLRQRALRSFSRRWNAPQARAERIGSESLAASHS